MKLRTNDDDNPRSFNLTKLYFILAIFRLLNAWLVRTQFDPDEYWQTLEPAYCAVLSRSSEECALTWEWTRQPSELDLHELHAEMEHSLSVLDRVSLILRHAMHGPIRSYVAVLPTIVFYRFIRFIQSLSFLSLSEKNVTFLVRKGPVLLHAILFVAPTDLSVYYITKIVYGCEYKARYALLASITSWFNGYALIRTYANSVECALCTLSFALLCDIIFKNTQTERKRKTQIIKLILAMFLGGLSVAIRFSSVAFWIPVGLLFCYLSESMFLSFALSLVAALLGLLASLIIDKSMYPSTLNFVFPSLGSFHFNVILENSSLYGTHSWYWYFILGLPTVCGILFPCLVYALKDVAMISKNQAVETFICDKTFTKRICGILAFYVAMHSFSSHKEFRFLMPILPLICVLSGNYIKMMSNAFGNALIFSVKKKIVILLFLTNFPHWCYLSLFHQRASISVGEFITDAVTNNIDQFDGKNPSFLVHYLMGCHSAPAYSYLYVPNIATRVSMLDCSPDCRASPLIECESEMFYHEPEMFMRLMYSELDIDTNKSSGDSVCQRIPDFLVVDSSQINAIIMWIKRMDMIEVSRFRHAIKSVELYPKQVLFPIKISFEEMVVFVPSPFSSNFTSRKKTKHYGVKQ